MPAGQMNRGTLASAYDRVLKMAIRNGVRGTVKPVWRDMVKVSTSNAASERVADFTGTGSLREKPEGAAHSLDAPRQGFQKEFVHKTYARGVQITMEASQDAQHKEMIDISKDLGQSVTHFLNFLVSDQICRGFSANDFAAADGVANFSASHLYENGQTYSNLVSAQVISPSALQTAVYLIMNRKNSRGQPLYYGMGKLKLYYAESHRARVVESLQALVPYSSDNTKNWLSDLRIEPVCNPYFTGTEWALADAENHTLMFFERMKFTSSREGDYQSGDSCFKVVGRCSVGLHNGHAMVASQGA